MIFGFILLVEIYLFWSKKYREKSIQEAFRVENYTLKEWKNLRWEMEERISEREKMPIFFILLLAVLSAMKFTYGMPFLLAALWFSVRKSFTFEDRKNREAMKQCIEEISPPKKKKK